LKALTYEEKGKKVIRPTKSQYYVDIARAVAMRSTCLRRRFGAVIVKNDQIISTGYNGAPRQTSNCVDLGYCYRQEQNIPSGQNYELCRAVHAEMNAVIHASRLDMVEADLYLVGIEVESGQLVSQIVPCLLCKRVIINAGISRVVLPERSGAFKYIDVDDWTMEDRISHRVEGQTDKA
jgi:dCMP deaminase